MPIATPSTPPRALSLGDPAPDVTLFDQQGKPRTLSEFRGRAVVLFFYPKAFTPACTAEACSFRDQYEVFSDHGVVVIGISSDSPQTQKSFAGRFKLPFILLSDPDAVARSAFGVPRTLGLFPGRMSFVIDSGGVIRHAFNSQLRAQAHIEKAIEVIKSLARPRA